MRVRGRFLSLCLTGALLTACAQGGGSGSVLPGSVRIPQTGAPAVAGQLRGAQVDFRFKIPRRKHRRAHFLSPATASIEVTAFDSTHTKKLAQAKLDTVPGSGGCTAVVSGTFVCTLSMMLPPGKLRIDAAAYDGAKESGKQLSMTSNLPVTIVSGKHNKISLALGGLPSTVAVNVIASSLETGTATSGFRFGGVGSGAVEQVQVYGVDADGYQIVNPGAPAVTLTSGTPAKLSVATATSYGMFNVTPLKQTNALASPNPSTAITLTAKATPIAGTTGAPVSGTIKVQNDPIVYSGTYSSYASVQVFAPWSQSPILQLPQSVSADYLSITVDAAGNVYVCNQAAGTVDVFRPGSTTPSRTLSGFTGPCYTAGVAVDASGNLFVPEFTANDDVKEFAPGSSTPSRTMPNPYPVIALDRSGNLYAANYDTTGISVFAPGTSTSPAFSFNAGMSSGFIPAFDSSGNLYVVNYAGGNVTEYTPPFSSGSAVAKTWATGIGYPYGLVVDSAGNLYVGQDSYGVNEYAPGAPTTVVRTLSSGDTGPVAVDQLDNVYVGAYSDNAVEVYPPGSSTSAIQTWNTDTVYAWYVAVWP